MPSIGFWKKRIYKFKDNPFAIIPFLKKYFYYNFVSDKYLVYYKDYNFLDYKETIDNIINNHKSIVRFGDEIIDMFNGIGLYYDDWHQKYDKKLSERLEQVLRCKNPKLLIGLHWQFFTKTNDELKKSGIPKQIWTNSKVFIKDYLHEDVTYGSALCFQPKYNKSLDLQKILKYFKTKNVIIVAKETKRFKGINFGKTTDFVECPPNNSWQKYDDILDNTNYLVDYKKYKKSDILFLISISSASKVMVFDLMNAGYQAWDTGQFFDLLINQIKKELS